MYITIHQPTSLYITIHHVREQTSYGDRHTWEEVRTGRQGAPIPGGTKPEGMPGGGVDQAVSAPTT